MGSAEAVLRKLLRDFKHEDSAKERNEDSRILVKLVLRKGQGDISGSQRDYICPLS